MRRSVFARWRAGYLAALAVAAFSGSLIAQTDVTTVRINGTVRDAEGGGLPGVTVEAKNQNTGLVKTTTTRAGGIYTIVDLPTGTYTVTATLASFKTGVRENIRIDLGMAPTIDFRLQLTTVTEAVAVTSQVPAVEVTNTAA